MTNYIENYDTKKKLVNKFVIPHYEKYKETIKNIEDLQYTHVYKVPDWLKN
jgi:hypothetical protein